MRAWVLGSGVEVILGSPEGPASEDEILLLLAVPVSCRDVFAIILQKGCVLEMSAPIIESSVLGLFLFSLISIPSPSLSLLSLLEESKLLLGLWLGEGVIFRADETDCLIAEDVLLKKVCSVGWLKDAEDGAVGFGVISVGYNG